MRGIRSRLTYANVVSTLCLFLLVAGGGAYAATKLGRNSVGTKQIKKGAVTPPKLSKSVIRKLKGERGFPGPQGPEGAPGSDRPLAVDATASNVAVDEITREVPLTGDTTWAPAPGEVGVLLANGNLSLATKTEETTQLCRPILRFFDNGRFVGSLTASLAGGPRRTLKHEVAAEGLTAPIAVLQPGQVHTISAEYKGEEAGDCARESQFDFVRVVVGPLGR